MIQKKLVERELREECKVTPTIGGKEMRAADMTEAELSQLSCLAVSDGISTAHYTLNEDHLLYSVLSTKRGFFMAACASNGEKLVEDMKMHGPYYVLKQTY